VAGGVNENLARIFGEMAEMLEILGENAFRVRAYENLSRIFGNLERGAPEMLASGELEKQKGVGESSIAKVKEYTESGKIRAHEELKAKLPEGMLDLLKIPGFGPKKARAVWENLGIASLHELEEAARSGRLEELPGFAQKTEANILAGIELVKKNKGRFLWADAMHIIEPALKALAGHPATVKLEIAGSLRRRKETVKDADLVVSSENPAATADAFIEGMSPERVTARGDTKVSVLMPAGMAVDIRIVPAEDFPYALHHFTGSKEHNVAMRSRAQKLNRKMNEYGLFSIGRDGEEKRVECGSEQEIFKALGLDYIPPELREDMGEIEAAERGELPSLIEDAEVLGAVHVHTEYSDGHDTVPEMGAAAKALGFSYLVVCDHSRSAYYAGGLQVRDVKRQWREIDALNAEGGGIRFFKGIECDILPDGSLDYDEAVLAGFDCVIASVHSAFTLDEPAQTARIIAAVRNRYVDVIGHLTGRLLLQRDGYAVDVEAVLAACAEHGVAVEINGNPNRLDLDWRWVKRAKELGVRVVLASDAHMKGTIVHTFAAVGAARKGWLEKKDVLNALSADSFLRALRRNA